MIKFFVEFTGSGPERMKPFSSVLSRYCLLSKEESALYQSGGVYRMMLAGANSCKRIARGI
jgi:hypothetical protein